MDSTRFDGMTRALVGGSRRGVLAGLAGSLGLAVITRPGIDARKKKKKRKKQTPKVGPNAYGCVDVGKPCRGNSGNCCSGICEGNKPRKGKKDTSRCVAHNTGGCQATDDYCKTGVAVACGTSSICLETTGKAPFCGLDDGTAACAACTRDADCETAGFGSGAACIVCPGKCALTQGRFCLTAGA